MIERTMTLAPGFVGIGVMLDKAGREQLERVVALQRMRQPGANDGQIIDMLFRLGMNLAEAMADEPPGRMETH